ncbi:sugar ABC transporter substrate-binding protein [Burkholderia sp. Leaf177]|uniref:sugar ABC transporter substrate-binding protein n=1 Tax=Burkholderia sp. Leaf177 TaxID=1736287 RepID=UPI0009E6DA12|nr:sugar ABC transporter substrate-binding protein [Burkholderia sp. Leaf177]
MVTKHGTTKTNATLPRCNALAGFIIATLLILQTCAAIAAPSADAIAHANTTPTLKGKRIGISVAGTEHYWDLKAYQGQIDEVKRLGGTPIPMDAGRDDSKQIAQLQALIEQKPDAIIEQLGSAALLEPYLKKIREAGIPLFTVDTASPSSINVTTSDNFYIGEQLALKLVNDLRGEGKILVFNGFYNTPVDAIRYEMLRAVLKWYPKITIIQPELHEVIPDTVENAREQIARLLDAYPKGTVQAIWAAWDGPQVGATQAVDAAQRGEIRTYGVDGSPEAVMLVKDEQSSAAAVVAQQPYLIGKTAVDSVARYLAGDRTIPPATYVPSILVSKENAAQAQKMLGQDKGK